MHHSTNYGLVLILLVAALSLTAGLVVVAVTGPESLRLASVQQSRQVTETPAASATFTQALEATLASPTTTATAPAATLTPTLALVVQETATPDATPSATATYFPTLAPDAVAIGRLVTDNNSTARLRSVPGLDGKVISAVQPGEYVQVLGGQTNADEIDWLPVRLNSGLSGWIAANLIETIP